MGKHSAKIVLLVVLIAITAFVYLGKRAPENDSVQSVVEAGTPEDHSPPVSQSYAINPNTNNPMSAEDERRNALVEMLETPPTEESRQWQIDHGYYMDLDAPAGIVYPVHSYDSLNNQTLGQMSDSGDMVAAAMLGDRLLRSTNPDTVETGLDYHKRAVVLGSTYSATVLGDHLIGRKKLEDKTAEFERLRDGIAWWMVAAERGDIGGNLRVFMRTNQQDFKNEFRSAACIRSHELRAELENSRVSAGYGPFEDQPMPGFESLPKNIPARFAHLCP